MSEKSSQLAEITWQGRVRVGILGGGQLSKMLVESALPMGLLPIVFGENAEDPAVRLSRGSVVGRFEDPLALQKLFEQVDVVVFENEFVPSVPLSQVSAKYPNVKIYPEISAMDALRDKAAQKQLLVQLGIPTAEFLILSPQADITQWLSSIASILRAPFILKWGSMGYDGKGVLLSASQDLTSAAEFCRQGISRGGSVYAEKKISFRRELALLSCRSSTGEFLAYPLVVSEQEDGICVRVSGPATARGTSEKIVETANEYAKKLARHVNLVGCFAIEFFETDDGAILANEIAPRVHNSGHFSQNAAATSQFENHLRAVLGWPLGSTQSSEMFVMRNLLGPAGVDLKDDEATLPVSDFNTHLHWYGKTEIRPGRKVGHLNAAGKRGDYDKLAQELERVNRAWSDRLQKISERKKNG